MHSRMPSSPPPSASWHVPYVFAPLRTKRAGSPVTCDSIVARGTPPSSSPASASTVGGDQGGDGDGEVGQQRGIGLEAVLVEVLVLATPERRVNVPVR